MVRTGFWILAALFLSLTVRPAVAQSELIVRLDDNAPAALLASLDAGRQLPGVRPVLFDEVQSVRGLFTSRAARPDFTSRVFLLRVADADRAAAVASRWEREPGVRYVQPNGRYALDRVAVDDLDDEPYADSLTHLRVIRADEAWERTTGAASVRLGIVDTGLYFDHPDFQGQVWTNPGEIPGNGLDDDGNGFVDDWRGYDFVDRAVSVGEGDYYVRDNDPSEDGNQDHGTLTAGVMSAALGNGAGVAGVAPGVSLVAVRAFGRDGVAEDDDLAAAIVYAADLGVDVINLSFGRTEDSPLLHEAIQYAYARGTVVVASGGNAGGDAPHYPSDYPEAIGVAWFTEAGDDIEPIGGQFGPGIDLGAPGTRVFTTLKPRDGDPRPLEEKLYGRRSGSSLAAPQVAGAAALLRSLDPTLTPEAIRGILTATARDLREPGWDHRTAAGLLDVANALGLPYPTNVSLLSPDQDGGTPGEAIVVRGSAIAPQFESWQLDFAAYDETESEPIGAWQSISEPVQTQVREATLGTWAADGLSDGTYLLRLQVALQTGQTLEDRRRIVVDRTPPVAEVRFAGPAYADGRQGVLVEIAADDETTATLDVLRGGVALGTPVQGRNREARHALFWPNERGETGTVTARVRLANAAGLGATIEETVTLDVLPLNSALFTETVLDVPAGYLLEKTTDFDADGLLEIVFNRLVEGEPSDSVFIYEWAPEGTFRRERTLLSSLIPRDEGDTDGDGRRELLFQFGANTFLLEAGARQEDCPTLQNQEACYPDNIAFELTTPPNSTNRPLWGARLTDLDRDGRGEIIGHDLRLRTAGGEAPETRWRIFEWDGTRYDDDAELSNPTSNSDPEEPVNTFNDPRGLEGDFDRDGRRDWLAGDNDGDFIVYENTGDNTFQPVWTYETDGFDAGSRLVQGDFDGDGTQDFWGFTTARDAGDEAPRYGLAHAFASSGPDAYALQRVLAFQGFASRYGTLAAADFDGDGTDELIVVHSPDVWVLSAAAGWQPIFHRGAVPGADGPTGYRSIRATVADFDGDGTPEVLLAGADGRMRLLSYQLTQSGLAPPVWAEAYARDAGTIALSWTAPAADSVTVYAATPGKPFSAVTTTAASAVEIEQEALREYALRAWYGSAMSDFGPVRTVRPHAPAAVAAVTYPAEGYVRLRFTERLAPNLAPMQFTLDEGGPATALLYEEDGYAVTLQFEPLAPGAATVRWTDVRDAEGTPVGPSFAALDVPPNATEGSLLLVSWAIVDGGRARLVFNAPLDAASARDAAHYRIEPVGTVAAVDFDPAEPEVVVLRIDGRALGATGLQTTVIVSGVRAASGAPLAPEGNVATLSAFADDLADVFVFPNPYRADEHTGRVVIAGLPREAALTIYSLGGEVVRSLEEFDGDGGAPWDLTDEGGAPVPSGIYLIRVEAEGRETLAKVAVIR